MLTVGPEANGNVPSPFDFDDGEKLHINWLVLRLSRLESKICLQGKLQGSPSLVNGVGLRTLSRRRSWVQIPPPALFAYFLPVSKERCHGLDPEFVLGLNLA